MKLFRYVRIEDQERFLDENPGWRIVAPGKLHGQVWSVIAEKEEDTPKPLAGVTT